MARVTKLPTGALQITWLDEGGLPHVRAYKRMSELRFFLENPDKFDEHPMKRAGEEVVWLR